MCRQVDVLLCSPEIRIVCLVYNQFSLSAFCTFYTNVTSSGNAVAVAALAPIPMAAPMAAPTLELEVLVAALGAIPIPSAVVQSPRP